MPNPVRIALSVHFVCGTVISCSITDTRTGQNRYYSGQRSCLLHRRTQFGANGARVSIFGTSGALPLAFFTVRGDINTSFGNAIYGTPDNLCDGELCKEFIFKWSARRTATRRLRAEATNDSGLGRLDAFIDIEATDSVPTPYRYDPSASISVKQGNGPFMPVGRTVSLNYNQPFDILMNQNLSLDCEMRFSQAEGVTGLISRMVSVEIVGRGSDRDWDNSARFLYLVDVQVPEPSTATLMLSAIAVRSANSAIRKRACWQKLSVL